MTEQDLGADGFTFVATTPNYTNDFAGAAARYQDFRLVFGTDAGRKVLAEIMRMGNVGHTSASKGGFDPYRTFYMDGMRNLAHQVFIAAHREPKEMPTRAKSKPQKE